MSTEEMVAEFSTEKASEIILPDDWSKSGIWIVYGKTEKSVDYTCLEVGQTSDMKTELEGDFKLITKEFFLNGVKVRRFREWSKLFFKKKDEIRHIAKWRDIANSYETICVKYVSGSETWDLQKRIEEEINIAINLRAIYFYPDNTKKQCKYIRQ